MGRGRVQGGLRFRRFIAAEGNLRTTTRGRVHARGTSVSDDVAAVLVGTACVGIGRVLRATDTVDDASVSRCGRSCLLDNWGGRRVETETERRVAARRCMDASGAATSHDVAAVLVGSIGISVGTDRGVTCVSPESPSQRRLVVRHFWLW